MKESYFLHSLQEVIKKKGGKGPFSSNPQVSEELQGVDLLKSELPVLHICLWNTLTFLNKLY